MTGGKRSFVRKPLRSRLPGGGFLCYKCGEGGGADAAVREKCCRSCLKGLVRKAFQTQLAALRNKASDLDAQRRREGEGGAAQVGELRRRPLFVALSGGDASLSLASLIFEAQRERNQVLLRQSAGTPEGGLPSDAETAVLIHVDLQRLFVHRTPRAVSETAGAPDTSASSRLFFFPSNRDSLPLRLKKEAARLWGADVVFIHPSGIEFRVDETPDGKGTYEEYESWPSSTSADLAVSLFEEETRLRKLLLEALSSGEAEPAHFCRAIL